MLNVIDLPAHPPFRPDGSLNIEQLEHEFAWGHVYENGGTGNKHIQASFGEYAAATMVAVITPDLQGLAAELGIDYDAL